MRNIAFIVTKSEIGGAQTWTNEMMKLVRDGNRVHLITSENGWLTQQENYDELLILPELKRHFSIIGYFKLLMYIKKEKILVMVASSANAGIYSRMAKLFSNYKCIYVSHGWSCIYNGGTLKSVFIKIEKYLSLLTDVVWCVSKSDAKKATDVIGIRTDKIVTLTNSVPGVKPREKRENNNHIVFVGRLTHPKRPELLMSVVAKHPDLQLDIIGGGERLEELKRQFKKYPNIRFLGEIQNFNDYANYDVFALISDSEGLPMSALEAHTAGLPMLLSDVGGCNELITNNGLLVVNEYDVIEDNLLKLIHDYESYFNCAQVEKNKFELNSYKNAYSNLILS